MNANRYLIGISKLENYLFHPFDLITNIENPLKRVENLPEAM